MGERTKCLAPAALLTVLDAVVVINYGGMVWKVSSAMIWSKLLLLLLAIISAEPTDAEIRKIAALVLAQAMIGVEDVTRDPAKLAKDRVQVDIDQVYRSKDQLYIRYSVSNRTQTPFRLTTCLCLRS